MKTYKFTYDDFDVYADFEFVVDPQIFTEDKAREALEFGSWTEAPDMDGDLVLEYLKKAAIEILYADPSGDYGPYGIRRLFNSREGFYRLDGSDGILLEDITSPELEFSVKHLKWTVQDED